MDFRFYPLRFEFTARESLYFPPGKAANILRGALGIIFRRIACVPDCTNAKSCGIRESCPYARVFEPVAQADGPSGLGDWPRPFVFRARHLDGHTILPGDRFHFDLHVFSLDPGVLGYFILTFAALAREGLGPRRGKAELRRVCRLPAAGLPGQAIYEQATRSVASHIEAVSLGLDTVPDAPARIRVAFLSPTELKHGDKIAERPEFPILFSRIRDRIATLRRLYGSGALDIDYVGTNVRAGLVRMTSCHLTRQEAERRSSRTGQSHAIGGFVGFAEYEGDLGEFIPYLEAASWTGVGRQSVWGKGEIRLHKMNGETGLPSYPANG